MEMPKLPPLYPKPKKRTETLSSPKQKAPSVASLSLPSSVSQVNKGAPDNRVINGLEDSDSSLERFIKYNSDYSNYLMSRHFEGDILDVNNTVENPSLNYSSWCDCFYQYANPVVGSVVRHDKSKGKKPINTSEAKGKRKMM